MSPNSAQPANQLFFDAMDVCCQKIVEKSGNKPVAEWRSADYNSLSVRLGKETKVYLSENTLKRIFGRLKTPQRYFPQKATRDAMAQFIGYRDWLEFELIYSTSVSNSKTTEVAQITDHKVENPVADGKPKAKKTSLILSIVVIILAIIIVALFLEFYDSEPKEVELVCINPYGNVPHTALFKLQSKKPFDQNTPFEINFMDEGLSATIKGKQEVTQFFKNPGVVYVTLLYKKKPIDTTTVYMQTKGWVANSANDTSRTFPVAGLRSLDRNNMYVSASQLDSAGLDISKPFLMVYSNIRRTNISGDNFELSCNIRAEDNRPGTQCIQSTIIVLGDKDRHYIRLYKPSCVAFSEYKFSEVNENGSSRYLGNIGYDLHNGGNIVLKIENKKISLIINKKKVLSSSYRKSIGKVMGVKFLFNGIGKVISPELRDLNSGEIF
jgi:hypothetical protein